MSEQPYRFSLVLRFFVERKGWTWKEAAKRCGIEPERMEKLSMGQHRPLAADAIRLQNGLDLRFKPEDFEERGLDL